MTTRHEIFTGLNFAVNTFRLGDALWSLENTLQGVDYQAKPLVISEGEDKPVSRLATVDEIKEQGCKQSVSAYNVSDKLSIMNGRINFDVGCSFLNISKNYIENDIIATKFLCRNAEVEKAVTLSDMETKAIPFINYTPKHVVYVSTATHVPAQVNIANIVNDLFDTMSYELQGLSSNSGKPHGWDLKHIKDMTIARLGTAGEYISRLIDKENFVSVGAYILKGVKDATITDLKMFGKYIDNNIEKLTMLRRWWAI